MSTNRAQYATQDSKIKEQLGEGNYELYRTLVPIGTSDYQAENQRLECGIMISSNALKELGEDEFIKMMRFVDWLWYSDEGLTLTEVGKEGENLTPSPTHLQPDPRLLLQRPVHRTDLRRSDRPA